MNYEQFLWKLSAFASQYKTIVMAEINLSENKKRKGVTKGKKLSTKVDLTPMVDLGFLLITFFIFTTTLSQPNVMKIAYPNDDTKDSMVAGEQKTISLILDKDNAIYYYNGNEIAQMQQTDFKNVRDIIIKKQQQVAAKFNNKKETFVLIKPAETSSYKNVVDIIDEMLINNVTRYVMMDEAKDEAQFIAVHFK